MTSTTQALIATGAVFALASFPVAAVIFAVLGLVWQLYVTYGAASG